ncbi:hypothetical protein CN918_30350 [Priestia megaterium]|nr:hypothetical protein CN918_30350 [Priestia megaterium]
MEILSNFINEEMMWAMLVGVLNSLPALFHDVITFLVVMSILMAFTWKLANDLVGMLVVWLFKQCKLIIEHIYNTTYYIWKSYYLYKVRKRRRQVFYK